jgi:hypothetical protein
VRTRGTQIRRRDLHRRAGEGHREANGSRGRRLICRGAGRGVSQSSSHVMNWLVRERERRFRLYFVLVLVEIRLAFKNAALRA